MTLYIVEVRRIGESDDCWLPIPTLGDPDPVSARNRMHGARGDPERARVRGYEYRVAVYNRTGVDDA